MLRPCRVQRVCLARKARAAAWKRHQYGARRRRARIYAVRGCHVTACRRHLRPFASRHRYFPEGRRIVSEGIWLERCAGRAVSSPPACRSASFVGVKCYACSAMFICRNRRAGRGCRRWQARQNVTGGCPGVRAAQAVEFASARGGAANECCCAEGCSVKKAQGATG